jgi:hypothetical protein
MTAEERRPFLYLRLRVPPPLLRRPVRNRAGRRRRRRQLERGRRHNRGRVWRHKGLVWRLLPVWGDRGRGWRGAQVCDRRAATRNRCRFRCRYRKMARSGSPQAVVVDHVRAMHCHPGASRGNELRCPNERRVVFHNSDVWNESTSHWRDVGRADSAGRQQGESKYRKGFTCHIYLAF